MKAHLVVCLIAVAFLAACSGTERVRRAPASEPAPMPPITDVHYRVYTSDGRPATFDDLAAAMAEAEVVFIGETHDDPVAHVLEAEVLQAAFARYAPQRPVALSLEMFDRDVQYVVDEYLDGLITEQHFLASANPWQNYATDYRPLVEFARAHGLDIIAANAPRRYVNRVSRLGPASLEALGTRAREVLPPLPYPEPSAAYRQKWDRAMGHMGPHGAAPDTASAHGHTAPSPRISNMLYAQALWDAGMANAVATYLQEHPDALVVHVVGGFHVEGGTGTPEVLQYYRPGTRTLIIAVQPVADVQVFSADLAGAGDFVIQTDAGLPRSFSRSFSP